MVFALEVSFRSTASNKRKPKPEPSHWVRSPVCEAAALTHCWQQAADLHSSLLRKGRGQSQQHWLCSLIYRLWLSSALTKLSRWDKAAIGPVCTLGWCLRKAWWYYRHHPSMPFSIMQGMWHQASQIATKSSFSFSNPTRTAAAQRYSGLNFGWM